MTRLGALAAQAVAYTVWATACVIGRAIDWRTPPLPDAPDPQPKLHLTEPDDQNGWIA